MLLIKWKTDNEGRLVAAWEEARGLGKAPPSTCHARAPQKAIGRSHAKGARFLIEPRSRALEGAVALMGTLLLLCGTATGQTTGTIRGTVKDPTSALIPGAQVSVKSTSGNFSQTTSTNSDGDYTFTAVPVGEYELSITAQGFKPYRQAGLVIDINSALVVDVTMELAAQNQSVTVTETVQIELSDTQLGEVIRSTRVTEVPLNGRSYTDLLATQGGVSPVTTSAAGNSTSGGGFGTVPVAGNENTGQFSINGQRESANGFAVNGASVQEAIGQQAGIVPNLDSIAEFRILSGNANAEYGEYSGGLIDVVTKSGGNQFHGSVFEFLRNTNLDSRGFFSPERSTFQQNQYGGTLGGPMRKDKLFFFADYQGQRTVQGLETGVVSVPSLGNRAGDFSPSADTLTGKVNGPFLAQTLSNRLGYPVSMGEPFFTPGCASSTQCVFPGARVPQSAFAVPATRLLQYIPTPNLGEGRFSSGAEKQRINDDKGSGRVDWNTNQYGNLALYYFADKYHLDNPYPSGLGGATVPGPGGAFDALSNGLDQLFVLRNTRMFGPAVVNEAHFSFTRLNNDIGIPRGGVGVSLADQGISSGPQGIKQGFPQYAGVEALYFNSFTVGTNPFFLRQVNNTLDLSDNVSKALGRHTIKAGGSFIQYKVKQLPNLVANGTFSFFGSGIQSTGNGFADFLLGLPDFYSQQSSPAFYESSLNCGLFAQDSWRIHSGITVNYGLRWDYITAWSEKRHQVTTFVPGVESETFPGAPLGYLVPGDPLPNGSRIPASIAPTPSDDFSPRLGIAYAPSWADGILGKLAGGPGKTSIRLGAGRFFTAVEGLTVAYPTGNPPYGLTYTSPEAPVMATPFIGALSGTHYIQQFPLNLPPYGLSPSNPDSNVDWSRYTPISGAGSVGYRNKTAYMAAVNFTIERQVSSSMVASASYVHSFSRHLLAVHEVNPGNPALCLSLSQPQDVAPGSPTCGPFAENQVFTRADGTLVRGTRAPFPNTIGTDANYDNMGKANYNALQLTLKRTSGRLTWLASYTYAKSLDWASSIQEQLYPYDFHKEYGISAFDIKHDFVLSYNYELPLERLFRKGNRLTEDWAVSGITRLAKGLPVTLASYGDNALVYVQNNGVNSVSIDLPDCSSGNLGINHNPRNGRPYFNTALFTPNTLGTPGTCSRRFFYGPGINNLDLVLRKVVKLREGTALEFRLESFNAFNHAQFYPNGSVDGNISSPTFGRVLKAAPPRIGQVAVKIHF